MLFELPEVLHLIVALLHPRRTLRLRLLDLMLLVLLLLLLNGSLVLLWCQRDHVRGHVAHVIVTTGRVGTHRHATHCLHGLLMGLLLLYMMRWFATHCHWLLLRERIPVHIGAVTSAGAGATCLVGGWWWSSTAGDKRRWWFSEGVDRRGRRWRIVSHRALWLRRRRLVLWL